MSCNLFFAIEVFEEANNCVELDLTKALELEGSSCELDFLTGLVFCSIVDSSVSCGQKNPNPQRLNEPVCADFRPNFLGLFRVVALETSPWVTRSLYVLFVKLPLAGLPEDLQGEAETLRLGFFRGEALPSKMSARRFLLLGTNILNTNEKEMGTLQAWNRTPDWYTLTRHDHESEPVNVAVSEPCSPLRSEGLRGLHLVWEGPSLCSS